MVLNDTPQPHNPRCSFAAIPGAPANKVPRQFLTVLSEASPSHSRMAVDDWNWRRRSPSKDNPLTARVMVNRVWMHHFGKGLVRTPGDFGVKGEAPTHPELLDWLAAQFMEDGWSLKKLHRAIMLSSTYQQSSDDDRTRQSGRPGEPAALTR